MTVAFAALTVSVSAEVPSTMSYQGRLADSSGNPVADTPHDITFRIYDEGSILLWEEAHTVTTADGLFSVELGSNGTPLTPDVFVSDECWLGIAVDGDPEMTPRTRLSTVPYAFRVGDVRANDIANEAGVAAYVGPSFPMYLEDTTYTVVCSLTIECPASGYVLAVAHSRIATLPLHTTGTASHAVVGLSDNPTSLPGNQDLDFQIDGAAPTGVYSFPYGLTSMFEVGGAGSYTYYYLAYEYPGAAISLADIQFNLVYFPTAYGTVDPVPPPQRTLDNGDLVRSDRSTSIEVDVERAEEESADLRDLERELAAMKARIEAIQRQIDSSIGARRGK
ncbi:hypothetical protein GF377_05690 [candidate division GN15 bacterium]|nr:hypothetical protein [candidate division GN15 bacterium]